MYEYATKDDLPNIRPPAMAYVRDEAAYYWLFDEGWRRTENSFLVAESTTIPDACRTALLASKEATILEYADGTITLDKDYLEIINCKFWINSLEVTIVSGQGATYQVNRDLTDITLPIDITIKRNTDLSFEKIVDYHYGWRNMPIIETTMEAGKVILANSQIYCVQDQIEPDVELFGHAVEKIAVPAMVQGETGIHIQDRQYRKDFFTWHDEPIGFVVVKKDAHKGDTSLKVYTTPESVGTKVNQNCKQVTYTEPSATFSACVNGPERSNKPWKYTNEMWLTGPWPYVDIELHTAEKTGSGDWPEGLNHTLTFVDPIPMPLTHGTCAYYRTNEWWLPPVVPGFGWVVLGDYAGTIGKTSIDVRIYTQAGAEYTMFTHERGATKINLFKPWTMLPSSQRRHSNLRGIAPGDQVIFENDSFRASSLPYGNVPIEDWDLRPFSKQIYTVTEVSETETQNPNWIKISPGLQRALYDAMTDLQNPMALGNLCYWIPAASTWRNYQTESWKLRCFGWTDGHGKTGVPIYVKNVVGKTLNLLAPLPGDIPAGTKMYMWSAVDNETMTYAYHDPFSYAYNIFLDKRIDDLQADAAEYNSQLDREYNHYTNLLGKAMEAGKRLWFTPPFYENMNLNDYAGIDFQKTFEDIAARRINIERPRSSDIEYISLLNYRNVL